MNSTSIILHFSTSSLFLSSSKRRKFNGESFDYRALTTNYAASFYCSHGKRYVTRNCHPPMYFRLTSPPTQFRCSRCSSSFIISFRDGQRNTVAVLLCFMFNNMQNVLQQHFENNPQGYSLGFIYILILILKTKRKLQK